MKVKLIILFTAIALSLSFTITTTVHAVTPTGNELMPNLDLNVCNQLYYSVTRKLPITSNLGTTTIDYTFKDIASSGIDSEGYQSHTVDVPRVEGYTPNRPNLQVDLIDNKTSEVLGKYNEQHHTNYEAWDDEENPLPSDLKELIFNCKLHCENLGVEVVQDGSQNLYYTPNKVDAKHPIVNSQPSGNDKISTGLLIYSNIPADTDGVATTVTGKPGETVTVKVDNPRTDLLDKGLTLDTPTVTATLPNSSDVEMIYANQLAHYSYKGPDFDGIQIKNNLGLKLIVNGIKGTVSGDVNIPTPYVKGYYPDKSYVRALIVPSQTGDKRTLYLEDEKVIYTKNNIQSSNQMSLQHYDPTKPFGQMILIPAEQPDSFEDQDTNNPVNSPSFGEINDSDQRKFWPFEPGDPYKYGDLVSTDLSINFKGKEYKVPVNNLKAGQFYYALTPNPVGYEPVNRFMVFRANGKGNIEGIDSNPPAVIGLVKEYPIQGKYVPLKVTVDSATIPSNLGTIEVGPLTGEFDSTVSVKIPKKNGYSSNLDHVNFLITNEGNKYVAQTEDKVIYSENSSNAGGSGTDTSTNATDEGNNPDKSEDNNTGKPTVNNECKINVYFEYDDVATFDKQTPLYTLDNGKVTKESNRALAANSDWYSDQFFILDNTIYYRVSTNEWVKSSEVYRFIYQKGILTTTPTENSLLKKSDYTTSPNRSLSKYSSWKYDRIAYIARDEKMFYRVSSNEFVSEKNVMKLKLDQS
ncbi:hypothetical protein [Companilactobacillus sp.]|jgi:hypothetical protein|uniref:hypothetical protein n=1 Tax=Companilactobacillus sp. TaxID=2767905 RepID=UPI0025C65F1B|nr:hypothetical protein [Companilactobacillus sp.]MCH4010088.1 hypothetical protein [Companilactobacillus sp.]MCH4052236.1 hypothetical protein [Companilactobacillus sp.]MCH4078030.1 hypothetical protein [Companilactobacillus sp.]MCH4126606.1 hypothetical protein [Companilactobacillus sp.]MCH4132191.1 hypothetical protein [Companilactobacillus sp.]